MDFFSLYFISFLIIVFIVNWAIKPSVRYIWLLASSMFFYATWDIRYTALLLFVILDSYFLSLLISKHKNKILKSKLLVLGNAAFLLFILAIFKYWTFLSAEFYELFRISGSAADGFFSFIAPVGLSFYILTIIGYMVDVYRGKTDPERNIGKYALFISFFPNILSGPIERSNNLLKQINMEKEFDYDKTKKGLLLILYGYFIKLLIANRISLIVDAAFRSHTEQTGATMMIALILYGIQLYCDFSGYSCIAIGIGKTLGYDLVENFRQPYFSTSVRDFWSRWHISLSSWLRDYVYIPLGGNRKGLIIQCVNLLITFLVSGLWHGTGLQFIIWGALHGSYQVISRVFKPVKKHGSKIKIKRDAFSFKLIQGIFTFALVDYAWLFFRSSSVHEGIEITKNIVRNLQFGNTLVNKLYLVGFSSERFNVLLLEIGIVLVVDIIHERKVSIISLLDKQNKVFRWLIYIALVILIIFGLIHDYGIEASSFIYTRF